MPRAACCLALLLLSAPAVAAQDAAPPAPVDSLAQVRVHRTTIRGRVVGSLVAADSQSVSLRTFADGEPVVVPFSELRSMDVYLGPRTRGEGAAHGAGRGLLVGLGATVVLGIAGAAPLLTCDDCIFNPAAGFLLGAASPGERWVRVRTPVVLGAPRT